MTPAPKPFHVVESGEMPPPGSGPEPQPVILYGLAEAVWDPIGYGGMPYGGEDDD